MNNEPIKWLELFPKDEDGNTMFPVPYPLRAFEPVEIHSIKLDYDENNIEEIFE